MNLRKQTIALAACYILSMDALAIELSAEEAKGFAACQAWSSAVLKTPEAFSEDWRAWAITVMATAIATPLDDEWSPFKDNTKFAEELQRFRAAFSKEQASSASPAYVGAHSVCMALLKTLEKQWK